MAVTFQSRSVLFSGELVEVRSWLLVSLDLEASTGVLVTVFPTSFLVLSRLRSGGLGSTLTMPLEMEDLEWLLDPESVLAWLRLPGGELG